MKLMSNTPMSSFVTMTKHLVDTLWEMNKHNRALKPTAVWYYRTLIQTGQWLPTNQGIGVSKKGILIDGQHRLAALREENYPPVLMLVVVGLDDDAFKAVDVGVQRTVRDYLHLFFDTHINETVSAILRTHLMSKVNFSSRSGRFTPDEYAEAFELLGPSIAAVLSVVGASRIAASALAPVVLYHANGHKKFALQFTRDLFSGAGLTENDPVLRLRNFLNGSIKGHSGNTAVQERYGRTLAALNARYENRTLTRLYRPKNINAANPFSQVSP
jgi:hypothetical protein